MAGLALSAPLLSPWLSLLAVELVKLTRVHRRTAGGSNDCARRVTTRSSTSLYGTRGSGDGLGLYISRAGDLERDEDREREGEGELERDLLNEYEREGEADRERDADRERGA